MRNLVLICFLFAMYGCLSIKRVDSGVIQYTNVETDSNGIVVDKSGQKIWFIDSFLLFEGNVFLTIDTPPFERKNIMQTCYYTLVNYQSKNAQRYANFRDSAKPVCNFVFKDAFASLGLNSRITDELIYIGRKSDTAIEGTSYKRQMYHHPDGAYYTYYLLDEPVKLLFSGFPHLEEEAKREVMGRDIEIRPANIRMSSRLNIIRKNLTWQEVGVLRQWIANFKKVAPESFGDSEECLFFTPALTDTSLYKSTN